MWELLNFNTRFKVFYFKHSLQRDTLYSLLHHIYVIALVIAELNITYKEYDNKSKNIYHIVTKLYKETEMSPLKTMQRCCHAAVFFLC